MRCSPLTLRPAELEGWAARWLVACAAMLSLSACNRQICRLPADLPRALDLTREVDRTHLLGDLEMARRAAEAYGRRAANHPPADGRFITSERLEQDARAYCDALLTEKISATHHLDVKTVEQALADLPRLSQR